MVRYNPLEFKSALSEIGVKKDDLIIVHNSLMNFGLPLNINPADLSKVIFDSLLELVGEGGTIAVPTFNFDFCKGLAFDRQRSPSKVMGVFSEYVRTLPGSKRSLHPMESIAVTGKLKNEITENDTVSSFADNGPFDKLVKYNAKILLLGTTINAASMIHLAEEKLNVPYRYWKTFRGEVIDNNSSSIREYQMYVRDLDLNPTLNISSIAEKLEEQNKIKEKKVGSGMVKLFYAKDFISITEEAIAKNPYYYVSNHPKYLQE